MRFITVLTLTFFVTTFSYAQWTTTTPLNTAGVYTGGNVGIGTNTVAPNSKLDLQGGGINIGGSGSADASLHIKSSFGSLDRLTQMNPASGINKKALNLMGATDANSSYMWWAWGILGTSGTWAFQPSTNFSGNTGLFINRSGNVGIGTASPQGILDVLNSATGNIAYFTGPSAGLVLQSNPNTFDLVGYSATSGYKPLMLRSGASGLQIETSGNVGIASIATRARLDINGKGDNIINFTNKIIDTDLQDMISVHSLNKTSTLNLVSSRADAGPLGGLIFTTTKGWLDSHANIAGIVGGRTDIEAYAGGYLSFWTKNNNGDIPRENMRLSHDGKMGIGIINPSAKLHILGAGGSVDGGNSNVFSGDMVIQANTGARSSTTGAQLEFAIPANSDGTNVWGQGRIITVAGNSNSGCACGKMIMGTRRYFDKYSQGSQWYYGDDLVIDSEGKIGIGTVSPDAKLTVKGDIHTREVKVDLNGAVTPDYVFEKDYDLLSLSELETYINQNKHLPEVPSAKEMEANGLNLKEMNLLLLKKVEELTLHLIEQNQINAVQQAQIQKLINEISTLKPSNK